MAVRRMLLMFAAACSGGFASSVSFLQFVGDPTVAGHMTFGNLNTPVVLAAEDHLRVENAESDGRIVPPGGHWPEFPYTGPEPLPPAGLQVNPLFSPYFRFRVLDDGSVVNDLGQVTGLAYWFLQPPVSVIPPPAVVNPPTPPPNVIDPIVIFDPSVLDPSVSDPTNGNGGNTGGGGAGGTGGSGGTGGTGGTGSGGGSGGTGGSGGSGGNPVIDPNPLNPTCPNPLNLNCPSPPTPTATPEPASVWLGLLGLASMAAARSRRTTTR
jgi:hypothetical protein